MGAVYRAKQRSVGRIVALKVIQAGELASSEERRRFRAEIEMVATLDHPHIVPIYEIGEHEGCPYYTMKVYQGTLADQRNWYRDPAMAAALVATVARAVHYGHQRGVLHRDLKPENILIDEHGRPHVGDFGAAKRMGDPTTTEPGMPIGTPMYMAPEQVCGGNQTITIAADVYSLGVVLYELITGRPPFFGDFARIMRAVFEEEQPLPPHQSTPGVPRELEAICLKCIERHPTARYRSGEELADDLERFMCGEPVVARPASFMGSTWRFIRRHWLVAGTGVGALLLLAVVATTAIAVAHAHESELERDTLNKNASEAAIFAKNVELQLRSPRDAVVHAAADPSIVRLIQDRDSNGQALEQLLKELNELKDPQQLPIDTIATFDPDGVMRAHAGPESPGQVGSSYAFREYYEGASQLSKTHDKRGYISPAFLSEADGQYKFAVAAPIYDKGDKFVGVLMASISTNSLLWPVAMDEPSGRTVVVIAPLDRSRADPSATGEYVTLFHKGLKRGESRKVNSLGLRLLETRRTKSNPQRWAAPPDLVADNDYRDPVPGFEGRWIAGFASVEMTKYVVIIQTRYDAAVAPSARLWRRLVSRVGIAFLAWSLVFGAGVWACSRRRSRALLARHTSSWRALPRDVAPVPPLVEHDSMFTPSGVSALAVEMNKDAAHL